jgi:hypothetical protein
MPARVQRLNVRADATAVNERRGAPSKPPRAPQQLDLGTEKCGQLTRALLTSASIQAGIFRHPPIARPI